MSAVEVNSLKAWKIDFTRRFMPEALTPLFHTPAYATLTEEQRLSYNQLHALYFNEQTMFFEKSFAHTLLMMLLSEPWPEELKAGLRQFIVEEEQHSEMFRALNLKAAPERYAGGNFHFIQVPTVARKMLEIASRHPRLFPVFLWLMHLQEERALWYAKTFLQTREELEPHFVETQRKHLADEVGHVRWDQRLIDLVWPQSPLFLRKWNVSLFAWMIGEYFSAPKRAGVRVIDALVERHTELRSQHAALRGQLLQLEHDISYRSAFYSRTNVPETLKRFDLWPEFRALARVMPGYIPQTGGPV